MKIIRITYKIHYGLNPWISENQIIRGIRLPGQTVPFLYPIHVHCSKCKNLSNSWRSRRKEGAKI